MRCEFEDFQIDGIESDKTYVMNVELPSPPEVANKDVAEAKAIVDAVPDICRAAIVNVAEEGGENLNVKFDNLSTEIERARALLIKAKDLDRKKELLQLDQ